MSSGYEALPSQSPMEGIKVWGVGIENKLLYVNRAASTSVLLVAHRQYTDNRREERLEQVNMKAVNQAFEQ